METIVKMRFGSHLYGTEHPESDTDYKGIFLPSLEDCMLHDIVKTINITTGENDSKNTKNDIDEEYYSLQYWLKLAEKGEMIVIDMLHAPDEMILETSPIWELLRANRSKFYTKNLSGYLGYIRKQTAKYGIKGSRLAAMSSVLKFIDATIEVGNEPKDKLNIVWNRLPTNEYCRFIDPPQETRWGFYEVCGKKFGDTITLEYLRGNIQKMYDNYGARAKLAEKNEGIDWKAVSHAVRASVQLIEIYTTGDLIFPLANADLIKRVKLGKLHYKNDKIGDILERNLSLVEMYSEQSGYPDKFDVNWAQQFIINAYQK